MTKEEALQLQNAIKELGPTNVNNALFNSPSRPKISRHKKRMTYYRERFALQMKSIIDGMIDESNRGVFNERFFKYDGNILSKNSLYLKITQSWLYLRDELDPNGVYKKFAEMICIVRLKEGIRLRYQKDVADTSELKAIVINEGSPTEQKSDIHSRIEYFLNNAKVDEELVINNILISEKEISDIESSICTLENFTYKILTNKIWIAKISE